MWINRYHKEQDFTEAIKCLKDQVLIVRGARQVGKTAFVINALNNIEKPFLHINCLYPISTDSGSQKRLGRDFLGRSPVELISNIDLYCKGLGLVESKLPLLVFIDEADQYPPVLEAIQSLAEYSAKYKFIMTGSNLENTAVQNAATGRKRYFDLYPITFFDCLRAAGRNDLVDYACGLSLRRLDHSDYYHAQLTTQFNLYRRLGGMPRLVDCTLDAKPGDQLLAELVSDLVFSIEENVKTVLGDKAKLYEYHDVLRTITRLSLNTLKFSRLQVQHAGRAEAKRLVAKTVGARVAHKIRLMDAQSDLSKYVMFDSGIANFLLNGSDLFSRTMPPDHLGILSETVIASELIAGLVTRDDLLYWRSGNMAELEFMLRSPLVAGIDVKTTDGTNKSLASFALNENQADCLIKITEAPPYFDEAYVARLATSPKERKIPYLKIPHYLTPRLLQLVGEL